MTRQGPQGSPALPRAPGVGSPYHDVLQHTLSALFDQSAEVSFNTQSFEDLAAPSFRALQVSHVGIGVAGQRKAKKAGKLCLNGSPHHLTSEDRLPTNSVTGVATCSSQVQRCSHLLAR